MMVKTKSNIPFTNLCNYTEYNKFMEEGQKMIA